MSDNESDLKLPFDKDVFLAVRQSAIEDVTHRFCTKYPILLSSFGTRGIEATREDIAYTIEFLRPVLEFGHMKPFSDYLLWLSEVLSSRGVPSRLVEEMLEWLAEFYEQALPGENGAFISSTLKQAIGLLDEGTSMVSQIETYMPEAWPETLQLEHALLTGNLSEARAVIHSHMRSGKTLLEVEMHLIQPALYQVGKDWQRNKVSVAQEHLATATAITLMAQEFARVESGPSNGKQVVCACVEGNHHAVGLRIVADAFEINGWEVIFLGPDVSTRDLVSLIEKSQPDLVCLSLSMPDHLSSARSVIQQLHKSLGDQSPAIMIGGLAINAFPNLSVYLGADLSASDATGAVNNAK